MRLLPGPKRQAGDVVGLVMFGAGLMIIALVVVVLACSKSAA